MDVMGTRRHSFARTDAAVAENPPRRTSPQPPPPGSELLSSLLGGKEVCGRPEEFQQRFVAPVGPAALCRAVRCRCTTNGTECTGGADFRLGGETTVTSEVSQEEEKVWVGFKEFHWYGRLGVTTDRVILGTHTQDRDGHLVHVSERFVTFPVNVPANCSVGATAAAASPRRRTWYRVDVSGLTEQRLLQSTQGAAGKHSIFVQGLSQHCPVPTHTHISTKT